MEGAMTTAPDPVLGGRPGHLRTLGRQECLRLLGSVPLGRIVFTLGALPAIRPVNHALVDDDIIIRTQLGSGITSADARRGGVVVAYEADDIDVHRHSGWSVVATGMAHLVREPEEVARYAADLHPWVDQPMDCVIRIRPELVTGYRLVPADEPVLD
jgi:hypothetical protein